MKIFNEKMTHIFNESDFQSKKIEKKLQNIIGKGFLEKNHCFFLKSLYKNQTHISENDFIDHTGLECFINSFHIDDYIENDYLVQGYLFIIELFKKWNELNNTCLLKAFLTKTDFGANVRFHMIRQNEFWIDEKNIENIEEPIMVITSDGNV